MKFTANLFLSFLAIVSASILAAASGNDVRLDENVNWAASARREILPALIDPESSDTTENDTENLVVQLRRIEYVISEDSIERLMTRVYRYTQADGIRDYGNLRTHFNAASDAVEIRQAMVIDSSGSVHVVAPDTVQILPTDTANVFSDSRFVLLPLTGLDVGSTAIVTDHVRTSRRDLVAPWGVSISEQFSVPQERLEVRFRWTTPRLRPVWRSEIKNMSCNEPSDNSVICVATNIPGYPINSDVFYEDVAPKFFIAEKRSWKEIRHWYQKLFESALTSDSSIAKMAAQLSVGLDDETEVLKAMHSFVATQVRYVGLEHGDFAFVPHRTNLTLRRRFGDCKDKTALLIDLLRQVGINMSPVLVSTGRRDPAKLLVPSGSYFDHLIVCGTLSDGQEYCLDSTDPYSGITPLSNWIQGAVALAVAKEAGPTVLPADQYRWALKEHLELTIADTGQLLERSQIEYSRAYGSLMRQNLSALNRKELHKWAVDDYHNTVSDLVEPDFQFSGIDAINETLTIGWDTKYNDMVSSTEDLEYTESSAWLNQILSPLESDNDAYDYRFSGVRYNATVTINIDEKWQIESTGPDINMQTQFGIFQRTHDIDGQKVSISTSVKAPAAVIAVSDIERFTRFLRILQEENRIRVEGTLRDDD